MMKLVARVIFPHPPPPILTIFCLPVKKAMQS